MTKRKWFLGVAVVLVVVGLASFIPRAASLSSTVYQMIMLNSLPAGASVDSTIRQVVCVDPSTFALTSCAPTAAPTSTPSPTPSPGALVALGSNNITGIALNAAHYMAYFGGGASNDTVTEGNISSPVSGVFTVKNLRCYCAVAPGGGTPGNTKSFIYRDGTTDQALKCNMQGAVATCLDTTNSFVTAAGDLLDIRVFASPGATPTATSAPGFCGCSVGP